MFNALYMRHRTSILPCAKGHAGCRLHGPDESVVILALRSDSPAVCALTSRSVNEWKPSQELLQVDHKAEAAGRSRYEQHLELGNGALKQPEPS